MRKIVDEDKRDVVRTAYWYIQQAGSSFAGEAYRNGFLYALEIAGTSESTLHHLEDELADMYDSYIEGDWR